MSDTQSLAAKMAVKLVSKLSDLATGKTDKPAQPPPSLTSLSLTHAQPVTMATPRALWRSLTPTAA